MSGLKPPELTRFYHCLASRHLTTEFLAAEVGVSRTALCRVLNGSRRRGPIWRRVEAFLTTEEKALLDVAHCHPWNKKRLQARPKWSRVVHLLRNPAQLERQSA